MKLLLLLTALFMQPFAYAGFEEGVAAYQKGDYSTAFKELKPLAEQGYAQAQYNLGLMYARGSGVAQDDKQAVSWYRKAAEQGVAMAQNNLGSMYAKGSGVAQDFVQAHMWWNIASVNGDADAREKRDMVAVLMSPKQREQAQKLASDWMRQHGN
jgi:hypothetical protein